MGESATTARGPTLATAETGDTLLEQSWSALEVVASALRPLEPLGGAPDLWAQKERLERALGRDQLIVQLVGPGCADALQRLVGVALLPPTLAAGVTLSVRRGIPLDYEAQLADGRRERAPADENPSLAVAFDEVERAIVADTEKARGLAVELQDAARSAAYARAGLERVDPAPLAAAAEGRSLWDRIRAFF